MSPFCFFLSFFFSCAGSIQSTVWKFFLHVIFNLFVEEANGREEQSPHFMQPKHILECLGGIQCCHFVAFLFFLIRRGSKELAPYNTRASCLALSFHSWNDTSWEWNPIFGWEIIHSTLCQLGITLLFAWLKSFQHLVL